MLLKFCVLFLLHSIIAHALRFNIGDSKNGARFFNRHRRFSFDSRKAKWISRRPTIKAGHERIDYGDGYRYLMNELVMNKNQLSVAENLELLRFATSTLTDNCDLYYRNLVIIKIADTSNLNKHLLDEYDMFQKLIEALFYLRGEKLHYTPVGQDLTVSAILSLFKYWSNNWRSIKANIDILLYEFLFDGHWDLVLDIVFGLLYKSTHEAKLCILNSTGILFYRMEDMTSDRSRRKVWDFYQNLHDRTGVQLAYDTVYRGMQNVIWKLPQQASDGTLYYHQYIMQLSIMLPSMEHRDSWIAHPVPVPKTLIEIAKNNSN